MRHGLLKRVVISYLIIMPVLFIAFELYLSKVVKHRYIEKITESLMIQGNLIAERIPLSYKGNLDDFCRRYKEKTGARVTIIDPSGRVLGDSDEPSEKMENHSDRPEIKEAFLNNVGSSIRHSNTLQKDFFYLAITFSNGHDKGILRLSMPLDEVKSSISQIRMPIISSSLAVLFLAILLGLIQAKRITRSIEEITDFSNEVAKGNFARRFFLEEKNELGELGRNISLMAEEIKTRLQQSEKERYKIEAILRNMSDGVMLLDIKGRIVLYNDAVRRLFNIGANIEGMTLTETLRNAELADIVNKAIKNEETASHEIEIMHPKEAYFMAIAIPFYAYPVKETVSGAILTLHDITRLKQLEEIRKDFVANVSHEIRTPITAIKGFAETLLDGAIDDRENAYKFLQTIKNQSERLNSLVNDLLTLSRIELGDIKIEKKSVDINDVIDGVFTTIREKARAKGLYLRKSLPVEIPEIYADKDRLIQILLNLVDNAIKFTETGGVIVGIEKAGGFNILYVEDTGIGVSERHLSRLGERFYRVDSARSREMGGTGLGLAIVKHLVKAHGWDIRIDSEPGKGTRVNIIDVT
ncbi:MAG: ATP-binding protein [Thermodesulfovibrionales bacterium]|nr:ATP-binding protein [Thermodesulfovibrionales bacterium]